MILVGLSLIAFFVPLETLNEVEIQLEDNTCRLTFNDLNSVTTAEESGDFSQLVGVNIYNIVKPAMFLTFSVEVDDLSTAIYKNGILYGLRIGVTTARVMSSEGVTITTFDIEVLDQNGRLYYSVTFENAKSDGSDVVYNIMSGKTLRYAQLLLPILPSKPGYKAIEWQLDSEKFTVDNIITQDIKIKPLWDPTSVVLTTSKIELESIYGTNFSVDLKTYIIDNFDKSRFSFMIDGTMPEGLILYDTGVLAGVTYEINTENPEENLHIFDVTISDLANMLDETLEIHLTVQKMIITATFSDSESKFEYNGSERTLDVTLLGILPMDSMDVIAQVEFKRSGVGLGADTFKHTGVYVASIIALKGDKSECYILAETVTKIINVSPKLATVVFTDYMGNEDVKFTYNYRGDMPWIYARVTNLYSGDESEVILSYSEMPIDVGVYTAYVESLSNPDYYIGDNNQSCTIEVKRAGINVICDDITIGYGTSWAGLYYSLDIDYFADTERSDIVIELNRYVLNHAEIKCGTYEWTLDYEIGREENEGVLKNYKITSITPGYFIIQRRLVEIAFPYDQIFRKEYDGDALMYLSNDEVSIPVQKDVHDSTGILLSDLASLSVDFYFIVGGAANPKHDAGVYYEYDFVADIHDPEFEERYVFLLSGSYVLNIDKKTITDPNYIRDITVKPKSLTELSENFSDQAILLVSDAYLLYYGPIYVSYYIANFNFEGYSATKLPPAGEYDVTVYIELSEKDSNNLELMFEYQNELTGELEYTNQFIIYGNVVDDINQNV
jgi:hypothetical protein